MIWQLRLLFALLIVATAAFMVLRYNEAIEDVAELKAQLDDARAAHAKSNEEVRTLLAYNAVLNATLAEKQSYDEAIRKQLGGVHRKLNLLMEEDPVVQEWGSTPLPSAVRSLLQDDRNSVRRPGDVRPSAGSIPAPDPDSESKPPRS